MVSYDFHPRGAWALATTAFVLVVRLTPSLLVGLLVVALPILGLFVSYPASYVVVGVATVYAALALLALAGLTVVLASHRIQGMRASLGQLRKRLGMASYGRLVAAGALSSLILLVASIPGAAFLAFGTSEVAEVQTTQGIIAALLFGVPLGLAFIRLLLLVPAALLENAGPRLALRRSLALTSWSFGRLLGSYALWFMAVYLVAVVIGLPLYLSFPYSATTIGIPLITLYAFFATIVHQVVVYYDCRVRKEFFDVRELD